MQTDPKRHERQTRIITEHKLEGDLCIPSGAKAIILFAHGSGSNRHSMRNQYLAQVLNTAGFATLLIDLLTLQEKEIDGNTRHLRFDINLLALRIESVTSWLMQEAETKMLTIGYFGSSTGAAAALIVASKLKNTIKAIISRGGRPDLAEGWLQDVIAPTLLIVGGADSVVIGMNKRALKALEHAEAKELVIIPKAGHLFEEPGQIEEVAKAAVDWFECYLLRTGRKFHDRYSGAAVNRILFAFKLIDRRFLIKFRDRASAGEILAKILAKYRADLPIVIGIPRGGVLVANVVARKLSADLDIIVSRRLQSPANSEDAIGSIMQDGSVYLDKNLLESLNVSDKYLEAEKLKQRKDIDRQLELYRPERKEYKINDKTVILVDDGAATGMTLAVVARWVRKHQPKKLVIAAPVVSRQAINLLSLEADHIAFIRAPSTFRTVEQFYRDFSPISDLNVIQILRGHT